MGLMTGKKGLVFGVANDHSIAWAIAEKLHQEGAQLGFTHLPDKDPANPKMERRVRKLADPIGAKLITPCNVQDDGDLDRAFAAAKETFGELDFVVHSIAYAPIDDLKGPVYNVSREGFKTSMDISVYSLMAVCKRARDLMPRGGSIITLSYLGGERVIPGYNVMGLCKAALESSVGYLAHELGPQGIRVNALMPARSRLSARRRSRTSTSCCKCTTRWPRSAGTSRSKKSARPASTWSQTCRPASRARRCTSTRATT